MLRIPALRPASCIDQLVNGTKFNDRLASDLIAACFVGWTANEYVDELKTVWKINIKSKSKFRMGNLIDSVSLYGKGYENLKLKQIADGYIVLNSACESQFTTYLELANQRNFPDCSAQASYFFGWDNLDLRLRQLNDSLRHAFSRQKSENEYFKRRVCSRLN